MRTTKFWSSTSITSSRYAKRCPRRESVASTCAHGTKRRHRTVVRSRIPTSQRRSKRSCGRSMQHSIPCASSINLRSSRRNYSLFKNSTETGNSNLLTVPLLNELQRWCDIHHPRMNGFGAIVPMLFEMIKRERIVVAVFGVRQEKRFRGHAFDYAEMADT